jgi:Zn-dependent protease with chaperone function|tara:strand:- start:1409 stop:1612 length:204 start_codon:yes stop_codon:yes gene_type:complete
MNEDILEKIAMIAGLTSLIGVIGVVIVVATGFEQSPLERFTGLFMAMFMFGFLTILINSFIWETFFD